MFKYYPDPNTLNDLRHSALLISKSDTFFQQLLGTEMGHKLQRIVFSHYIVGFYATLGITGSFLYLIHMINPYEYRFVGYWLTFNILVLIYAIIWALSMNRVTTKLVVFTFEFWFKLLYMLRWWICSIIYYRKTKQYIDGPTDYLGRFALFVVMILFCLLDGLRLSLRVKVFIVMIATIMFTLESFKWTFILTKPCYLEIASLAFDITSLAVSSIRIVTIFEWRQTILSIFRKNTSTFIKKSVKIVWL